MPSWRWGTMHATGVTVRNCGGYAPAFTKYADFSMRSGSDSRLRDHATTYANMRARPPLSRVLWLSRSTDRRSTAAAAA